MAYAIRPFHMSDLWRVYYICKNAVTKGPTPVTLPLPGDPELVAHYYAANYCVLEPDLCFLLTSDETPVGYVLGTRDTTRFWERCEREWFPVLRQRYKMPAEDDKSGEAGLIRRIHAKRVEIPELLDYPAHLHIDLLPEAQGQGWGRHLMNAFLDRLEEVKAPAVHLGVNRSNAGAVVFYEKMGFQRVLEYPGAITFGMKLPRKK